MKKGETKGSKQEQKPSKKVGTKNRKGGKKVRKLAPERRMQATLEKFQRQVHAAKVERGKKEAVQVTRVREEGMDAAMFGTEYQSYLRNVNNKPMAPEKVARVLG